MTTILTRAFILWLAIAFMLYFYDHHQYKHAMFMAALIGGYIAETGLYYYHKYKSK